MRRILPLVYALLIASSCASAGSARHIATVGAQTAHSTLAVLQETADAVTCGKPTAPPQCITPEVRATVIAPKLSAAFAIDGQAAKTIRAVPVDATTPAEVATLYTQITQLANEVLALIPRSTTADASLAPILKK